MCPELGRRQLGYDGTDFPLEAAQKVDGGPTSQADGDDPRRALAIRHQDGTSSRACFSSSMNWLAIREGGRREGR